LQGEPQLKMCHFRGMKFLYPHIKEMFIKLFTLTFIASMIGNKSLEITVTNQNCIHEGIKSRL